MKPLIHEILKQHNVYNYELELDLMRAFEDIRAQIELDGEDKTLRTMKQLLTKQNWASKVCTDEAQKKKQIKKTKNIKKFICTVEQELENEHNLNGKARFLRHKTQRKQHKR